MRGAGQHGATIAVIEDRVPNIDKGAGDPRSARIAQALGEHFAHRHLLWLTASAFGAEQHTPMLERFGFEVRIGDVNAELEARAGTLHTVIVARPHNWVAFRGAIDAFHPNARRVYDAESLFSTRTERESRLAHGDRRAQLADRAREEYDTEVAAMQWADAVLCVADDAAAVATSVNPGAPTFVAAHAVDVPPSVRSFDERGEVVVFGGFLAGPGSPNEDAAIVAAKHVAPLLEAPLIIAGAVPTPNVEALANRRVFVIGPVDDSIEFLSRYRVQLCPLRFGAGLKLRCVDSAAAGTPLATTPYGAENLGLNAEMTRAMVGESPAELAAITTRLLTDEHLWWAMHEQLRALVFERYTQHTLGLAVRALIDAVEASPLTLVDNSLSA